MLWSLIRNAVRAAGNPRAPHEVELKEGIARLGAGDLDAARRHFSAARAAAPYDYDVLFYLGVTEARGGDLETALKLLESARVQRDNAADLYNAFGNVHRLRGRLDMAVTSYRCALERDSDHVPALVNLGSCLREKDSLDEALAVLDRALQRDPGNADAIYNKALVLVDGGAGEAAIKLLERALELEPEFAEAHTQLGFLLLRRADFAAGWREYAWRTRTSDWPDHARYPVREWTGEPLSGKNLLVRAEQGLGDQIMFASCLHDVIALAQRVIIECDPRLIGLFTRSFPAASVHRLRLKGEPEWAREPAPDFQIHCGGLPGILRQHISDFPRHQGYLAPDPVRVARWQARFAALPSGLNIGLSWRGGTPRTRQTTRSISLTSLVPLLSVSRANFVSLQYGPCGDEISELRANHAVTLHDWLPATTDLEDVAALIANLDIVITVCTTVAHLCGALARTAWVMVPAVAEWRYLDDGSTLPWYPSVQLFRQQRRGAWGDVIASVGARLHTETERFFASGRSTSSLGRPE